MIKTICPVFFSRTTFSGTTGPPGTRQLRPLNRRSPSRPRRSLPHPQRLYLSPPLPPRQKSRRQRPLLPPCPLSAPRAVPAAPACWAVCSDISGNDQTCCRQSQSWRQLFAFCLPLLLHTVQRAGGTPMRTRQQSTKGWVIFAAFCAVLFCMTVLRACAAKTAPEGCSLERVRPTQAVCFPLGTNGDFDFQ